MLKRVEAMELQKFGKVSVDTTEERVQALELAVFDLENVKGLLSLRMEDLELEREKVARCARPELAKMHYFATL